MCCLVSYLSIGHLSPVGCTSGLNPRYSYCSQRQEGLELRKQTYKCTWGQYPLLPQVAQRDIGSPDSDSNSTLLPIFLSYQVYFLPLALPQPLYSDSIPLPSLFILMTGRSDRPAFHPGTSSEITTSWVIPSILLSSSLQGPAPLSRAQHRPQAPGSLVPHLSGIRLHVPSTKPSKL